MADIVSFSGFKLPKENWSKLPHQLIDNLPKLKSLGEAAVILYTLRHTWGYQEYEDWNAKNITTDEYMHGRKRIDGTRLDNGTGLSKPTIYKGLDYATEHGFLIRYVDNTDLGRITHYYRLRSSGADDDIPSTVYACDPKRKGISNWHTIPRDIKDAVYARFQGRCAYCEKKSRKWHYDHIYPQSRGGLDEFDNLALACPQCNMSKHDRTPDEWGHPVIFYENDVKILYRGWERFFTGGGNESLPRTEKETISKKQKKVSSPNGAVPADSDLVPAQKPKTKRKRDPVWDAIVAHRPPAWIAPTSGSIGQAKKAIEGAGLSEVDVPAIYQYIDTLLNDTRDKRQRALWMVKHYLPDYIEKGAGNADTYTESELNAMLAQYERTSRND